MFGLKRRKPELAPDEPIRMEAKIEISRSAEDIYALLDFADPRNQMVARGNIVKPLGSDPNSFRMWYDLAPDLNFLFTVTDAEPARRYAYSAVIVPSLGRRAGSHEDYAIERLAEDRCEVTFVNTVHHQSGLTLDELAEEIGMSSVAAANGLAKLKLLAEEGVEAVEAFEWELGQR